MRIISALILITGLSGCTTTVRDIPSSESPVSSSQSRQHCREVQQQCDALEGEMEAEESRYEEWNYADGSVGCRCND